MSKRSYRLLVVALMIGLIFGIYHLTNAAEKVTLVFWSGYPEMTPFFDMVVKDYQKAHPNVTIEASTFELREVERKLAVSIPAGTGPDIFQRMIYIGFRFVEGGFVHKNPPKVASFVKSKAFDPWYAETVTYKGDTYGVPSFQGVAAIFWNKKMFREAGLPSPPSTMQELMDYARKLVKYDDKGNVVRSGVSLRLSGAGSGVAEKYWYYLYPTGGDIMVKTPKGKYHNGYDNEAGRETLKFWIDALYKYHVTDHKIKHDAEAFALELAPMFAREAWVIGYMKKHAPQVEYDTVHMPKYRRWGTDVNPEVAYVTKTCKHPDIAWDFVLHMQKPEYQRFMLENIGWLPCRQDVDFSDIIAKTPQFKTFVTWPKGYVKYTYPMVKVNDEVYTKLAERLVAAYLDKGLVDNPQGIAKVVSDAARETDEILKEAGLYGTE